MAENSILNLMVAHHALIESIFSLFRDEAKEKSHRASVSLSELKWEIRKHFFIEENAIFDFLPLRTMDIYKKIVHLRDEHVEMISMIEKLSVLLLEESQRYPVEEMEAFENLLASHREVEEKELYPTLDKEIREDQKHQIIHRINEVPIKITKK